MIKVGGARPLRRPRAFPSALIRFAAFLALVPVGVWTQTQPSPSQPDANRPRLLQLQREAVVLLTNAGRSETPADEVRRALRDAAERLQALGAEPGASAGPETGPLPPPLRAELRGAAEKLLAASSAGPVSTRSRCWNACAPGSKEKSPSA